METKNTLNLYKPFQPLMSPKNGFNNWFVILLLIVMAIGYFLIQ